MLLWYNLYVKKKTRGFWLKTADFTQFFFVQERQKKLLFFRTRVFSVIFAFRRVILLRSDIWIKVQVIFASRVLKANIISLLRKQKYHYAVRHNITLCEAQNITINLQLKNIKIVVYGRYRIICYNIIRTGSIQIMRCIV